MIQFLPLALSLVSKLPIVQELLGRVPEGAREIAAKSIVQVVQSATRLPLDELGNMDGQLADDAAVALINSEQLIIEHAAASMTEARSMYTHDNGSREQADRMAERIMDRNLWLILLLIVALSIVIGLVKDSAAVGIISTVIGAALNQLYTERSTVMSFYYASMDGVQKLLAGKDK